MLEFSIENLIPMAPTEGPPLPRIFEVFWPWVEEGGEEPPAGDPPVAPAVLVGPADGAEIEGTSIEFSWQAVAGAESYYLVVGIGPDFQPRLFADEVFGLSKVVTGFPNDGTVYRWMVVASNSAGLGPYSEVRSFTNVAGSNGGSPPEEGYSASASFVKEAMCEVSQGDRCLAYSSTDRIGKLTVTNKGKAAQLKTKIRGYLCFVEDNDCNPLSRTSHEWNDNLAANQVVEHQFNYSIPDTGMQINTRFEFAVYDPNGNVIYEDDITTSR